MPSLFLSFATLFVALSLALYTPQTTAQAKDLTPPAAITIAGFDEPLLPLSAETHTPLKRPPDASNTSPIDRLSRYLALNRNTPWEASIQLNLGLAYYRNGYFSDTFPAFERAWELSRNATKPTQKALADRAFGELVRMHARLGHADRVATLLAIVKNRTFTGPATEAVAGAREGLWTMRNNPGIAYLCGPKALYSLLQWQQPDAKGLRLLDAYRSGANGVSLAELEALAERADMHYRPAYRATDAAIPVPSVIHWQVNHYAAIVEKRGELFHVKDPTFGQDLWLTKEAIDTQASGYFLVPKNDKNNWQPVAMAQAESVHGQGYTGSSDQNRTTPCDQVKSKAPCDGSPKQRGMADYDVHTMLVSLNITDTLLSHTPPNTATNTAPVGWRA